LLKRYKDVRNRGINGSNKRGKKSGSEKDEQYNRPVQKPDRRKSNVDWRDFLQEEEDSLNEV